MAAGGELVELGARKAPLGSDQFGADALWHQAVGVARVHALAERVAARRHLAAHRDAPHRFHAGGDHQVVGAGDHTLGREADGLLAAAALTVDGDAGDRLRESRSQQGVARDVDGLVADLGDGAGDDVVDLRGIDAGARHQFAQAVREQVGGQHVVQRAARFALADGRAHCSDDDGVAGHGSSSSPSGYINLYSGKHLGMLKATQLGR